MARQTLVELTDDVDGSPAAETVTFGLDGVHYEIDLSDEHATELRESVALYVQHARKSSSGRSSHTSTASKSSGYEPKAVRAWAAANGVEVPARGRIPSAVLAQYLAAGN